MDAQIPMKLVRPYATEESFASPGSHYLRPWMLPHELDYGLRGTCDVEQRFVFSMFSL